MNYLLFFPTPSSPTFFAISSFYFKPKNPSALSFPKQHVATRTQTLEARDTVIDFGKHKGKMLGTLPSTYLKWVSKNLRARDFEYWAKLADEVLEDPVYQDRIEWEFAERVLHGSHASLSLSPTDESAVSMLLEISERFGWDNDDKTGWSKVNFELLGTSRGGRIPRLPDGTDDETKQNRSELIAGHKREKDGEVLSEIEGRRRERRERDRLRRGKDKDKMGIRGQSKGTLGNGVNKDHNQGRGAGYANLEPENPFPGREALLRKVLNRRKFT